MNYGAIRRGTLPSNSTELTFSLKATLATIGDRNPTSPDRQVLIGNTCIEINGLCVITKQQKYIK